MSNPNVSKLPTAYAHTVTWESEGLSSTVSIYECIYGGGKYLPKLLESGLPANGSYSAVSPANAAAMKYKIVSDADNSIWDWNRVEIYVEEGYTVSNANKVTSVKDTRNIKLKQGKLFFNGFENAMGRVSLYTISGRKLASKETRLCEKVDLSGLKIPSSGVLVVRVNTNGRTFEKRIIRN